MTEAPNIRSERRSRQSVQEARWHKEFSADERVNAPSRTKVTQRRLECERILGYKRKLRPRKSPRGFRNGNQSS